MPRERESKTLILRYSGELTTKGKGTRRRFQGSLLRNLRDALATHGVHNEAVAFHERIFVEDVPRAALDTACRVFGLQSASLAESFEATDLASTIVEAKRIFAPLVAGKRFAVRAKTVGGSSGYEWSGGKLERELGAALLPDSGGVDLSQPEVTARVETHLGRLFAVTETRRGPGGLPMGDEGRALALVSGGFDSAVAAWQMMRRGVRVDFLFCNLGGAPHAAGTLRVMKLLADRWAYGTHPRFIWLEFDPVVSALRAHCTPRYWQILLKRLMLRAATRVAESSDYDALVTGEAVGQVSSQTLRNLAAISEATPLTILRPLVGANKDEIIGLARHIGTEEASAQVEEYCALNRKSPATAAKLEALLEEETQLPDGLLAEVLESSQRLDLRSTEIDFDSARQNAVDKVPPGAVVLDVRPRALFESFHLDGALSLEWSQAIEAFESFSKDQPYLVCCEYGVLSAHLVERMRALGFEAFHLEGGVRAMRRQRS